MAMSENRSYIPIRVSSLTHILKNKIGNKCDTRLVACMSGEQCHLAETLASLRFAVRLRGVICSPQQEVMDDPNLMLTKLKKDLAGLKSELYMQDMMARRAPKMHGELSHKDCDIIQQQVELYLDDKLDNIPIVSVRQMEAVLESVKATQEQREVALREQITAEMQQQLQLQLEQLQQQLAASSQQTPAQDHRPSVPQHGRERGNKRRTSRVRVGKDAADDDKTETRSRREERQQQAGAASNDQSGPGFGVGVADGRPNAAAVAMSARARGRGGGPRGGAGSERQTSPAASTADDAGGDEVDLPLPTEPEPASSQEALRRLLTTDDGAQLQSGVEEAQRALADHHQQYVLLARALRELRCQQSGLQTDLQLAQAERHVQGERYTADGSLLLSTDERQLTQQLRQLSGQLADTRDRLCSAQRDLVEAQRQLTEKKADLSTALADFRLRNNDAPDKEGSASIKAGVKNEEGSGSAPVSAAVQAPPVSTKGSPTVYYGAQRKARLMLRRTRCPK